MKAFVDPERCIGCTQCASVCPVVFGMEGTLAVVLAEEIPPEQVPHAAEAQAACPVNAIQLLE